jgi:hypothetical protein
MGIDGIIEVQPLQVPVELRFALVRTQSIEPEGDFPGRTGEKVGFRVGRRAIRGPGTSAHWYRGWGRTGR